MARTKSQPQQNPAQKPTRAPWLAIGLGGAVAVLGVASLLAQSNEQQATSTPKTVIAYSSPHSSSKPITAAKTVALGQPVPDARFADLSGKEHQFSEWRGQMTLIFFADTACPCVQAYDERMKALDRKFNPQGLRIVYVFPQMNESRTQISRFAKAQKYTWPCVPDPDQKLLAMFNAQCTTEAFLLDTEGRLRYHGRVDESTFAPEEAKNHDLEAAITALIAGKKVTRPETQAYACTIMRKPSGASAPAPKGSKPKVAKSV